MVYEFVEINVFALEFVYGVDGSERTI